MLEALPGETRGQYRERIGQLAAKKRESMKRTRGANRQRIARDLAALGDAWDKNRALCLCGRTGTLLVWRAVFGGATGSVGIMHETRDEAEACRDPKHDNQADSGPVVA